MNKISFDDPKLYSNAAQVKQFYSFGKDMQSLKSGAGHAFHPKAVNRHSRPTVWSAKPDIACCSPAV